MTIPRLLIVPMACATLVPTLHAQAKTITAADAKDHVGERATVCGKVASTHYSSKSKGQPTFLNLDDSYPKEVFTIVIWGSDRSRFGEPESKYKDQRVCVNGRITSYHGEPEIVAGDASQLEIQTK